MDRDKAEDVEYQIGKWLLEWKNKDGEVEGFRNLLQMMKSVVYNIELPSPDLWEGKLDKMFHVIKRMVD